MSFYVVFLSYVYIALHCIRSVYRCTDTDKVLELAQIVLTKFDYITGDFNSPIMSQCGNNEYSTDTILMIIYMLFLTHMKFVKFYWTPYQHTSLKVPCSNDNVLKSVHATCPRSCNPDVYCTGRCSAAGVVY